MKLKNAIIKRDSIDESFALVDPNDYFKEEDVLIAIDSDTLITIQLLVKSIIKNEFKTWEKITEVNNEEPISSLFVKLGYKKEEVIDLLKEL